MNLIHFYSDFDPFSVAPIHWALQKFGKSTETVLTSPNLQSTWLTKIFNQENYPKDIQFELKF